MCYVVYILTLLSVSTVLAADNQLKVKTNSGEVNGIKLEVLGREVHAFLGIPYAVPPVGDLRFRKPLPVNAWQGVYDATKKSPSCPQYPLDLMPEWTAQDNVNEDCLYLNLWVPAEPAEGKATIIWIHGGSFLFGSSTLDLYDGQVLASKGNIIVASMNYRLGALGFLSSGTEEAPGNMGLHDQLLAIQWIKDNLRSFGGDPSLITLSGQSAGAISSAFHLVSPLSRGLFKRVILQSGTAYNRLFAFPLKISKLVTAIFAIRAGCKGTFYIPRLLDCLRNKTAEELYNVEAKMVNETFMMFFPIYGDDFLPHHPMVMVTNGISQPADVLIGTTADEGSMFLSLVNETLLFTERPKITRSQAERYIRKALSYNYDVPTELVIKKYLDVIPDDYCDLLLRASHQAVGDCMFLCPSLFSAEKYSKTGRVYYYHYTHRASRLWKMSQEWMGVHHGQEVSFVFGEPLRNSSIYLKEEVEFDEKILEAWSSFVKNGIPHYEPLSGEWPKFTTNSSSYVELNPYRVVVGKNLKKDKCDFWRQG